MGMDVNLYAEGTFTEDEVAAADALLLARCPIAGYDETSSAVGVADYFDIPRVELLTLSRYYGPGYERGNWPLIYGAIRLMRVAFPSCRVFYGSDSTDDGIECTDTFLDEMWAHFLGPNGDDYRSKR